MNIPGFTAEKSLLQAKNCRRTATAFDTENILGNIQPAAINLRLCDWLSERVWGAYNEGAFNRAEFWGNVMDHAGCFA
jgi:hypothetical protein